MNYNYELLFSQQFDERYYSPVVIRRAIALVHLHTRLDVLASTFCSVPHCHRYKVCLNTTVLLLDFLIFVYFCFSFCKIVDHAHTFSITCKNNIRLYYSINRLLVAYRCLYHVNKLNFNKKCWYSQLSIFL